MRNAFTLFFLAFSVTLSRRRTEGKKQTVRLRSPTHKEFNDMSVCALGLVSMHKRGDQAQRSYIYHNYIGHNYLGHTVQAITVQGIAVHAIAIEAMCMSAGNIRAIAMSG